jgi:hypothetical protein
LSENVDLIAAGFLAGAGDDFAEDKRQSGAVETFRGTTSHRNRVHAPVICENLEDLQPEFRRQRINDDDVVRGPQAFDEDLRKGSRNKSVRVPKLNKHNLTYFHGSFQKHGRIFFLCHEERCVSVREVKLVREFLAQNLDLREDFRVYIVDGAFWQRQEKVVNAL